MAAPNEKQTFFISAKNLLEKWPLTDTIKDDKICVASFFGKESCSIYNSRASIINSVIGMEAFSNRYDCCESKDKSTQSECYVEGFYYQEQKTLYLNLHTYQDTTVLVDLCEHGSEQLSEQDLYKFWQNEEFKSARALFFLFHVSHIIVLTNPGSSLDISYVRLFRTLDNIRIKLQPLISEQLNSLNISMDWKSSARVCSPRVLFVFMSNTLTSPDKNDEQSSGYNAQKTSVQKRLQHAIEDQIYRILRKSRVITNISNNSLFAVPANQEFVHVLMKNNKADSPVDNYLNLLARSCNKSFNAESSKSLRFQGTHQSAPKSISSFCGQGSGDNSGFRDFITEHINLAVTKGFDDNLGKSRVTPMFELPSLNSWQMVASKLAPIFYGDTREMLKIHSHFNTLKSLLDVDSRFSENRCNKVVPLAESTYQDGLPKHYTKSYHEGKLNQARKEFYQHARGPACERYLHHLEDDCIKFWQNGHQLCEEISLTGRHCVHQLHRLTDAEITTENDHLPIMQHSSQSKVKAACNCGRSQTDRDDPFTHKEANYDFYMELEKSCCGTLEHVEFPVFKPSLDEPISGDTILSDTARRESNKTDIVTGIKDLSLGLSLGQSGGGGSDLYMNTDQSRLTPAEHSAVENATDVDIETATAAEKSGSLERQLSTTEYIAGMVHSNNPSGLLPKFSSWSLCSLGKSTLYVPSQGIDQPGFVHSSNFLLPWDVTVKYDKEKWPSIGESSGKRGKSRKGHKESTELNLRIHIGEEYECNRGHRFFCSAPDKAVKATSGQLKDAATKLLNMDMPLYFPCHCRSGSKSTSAQLMRIYVAIPDGPVQIQINPRVQPGAPPCPVFQPEANEPIILASGSLWVLRLPYIYVSEHGVCLLPADPQQQAMCRLLKGVFSLSEPS